MSQPAFASSSDFLTSVSRPPLPPRSPSDFAWRFALVALPLVAFVVPVFWLLARMPETPVELGTWVLLTLSAIANVAVIAFHYTVPAHPKFLMLPWRRWVLRVHIVSGTTELVAGLWACFGHNATAALVMAVAALFFHVPSAIIQTRIVFGSKAVMVPSYLLCIATHGFCAAMLLAHPDSTLWAVRTFLIFNVYVWCRVYFYVFDLFGLFASEKYTVAILAAGCTMLPAVFGSLTFLLIVGFIGLYVLLYRAFFARTPEQYAAFVRERARESTMRLDIAHLWGAASAGSGGADAETAAVYFRMLDSGSTGKLDRDTLRQALAPWGLPPAATDAYADRLLAAGPMDLEGFTRQVWSIGAVRQHGARVVATDQAASERDRAELVFRHLDFDGDGRLTSVELELLLENWGLPRAETARYIARTARSTSGQINFDEFFHAMRPMWRFIYFEIFRAEYGTRRGEMIGRSVTAITAARKADSVRDKLKRNLLARVPFLEKASDELIADLAASLVPVRCRAGEVLFAEGGPGDRFFVVASGVVRVSRRGEKLADLGTGGCLGEGALLTDERRAATVTAVTDAALYSLTRASFGYLTEKYPAVQQRLRGLHENRRKEINLVALRRQLIGQVPFLHQAGEDMLADLAEALVPVTVEAGRAVVREGDAGDQFFLVEEGSVRVSRAGDTLAHLGAGACFGEGALLTRSPRMATATTLTPTRLLALKRDAFERVLQRHPSIRMNLVDLHVRRSRPPIPSSAQS